MARLAAGRGRVLSGFLGIVTGGAIAQLLAFLALPLLARIYTPEDTAHYTLLLGLGAVMASFASLRLDLAIPIPGEIEDSRRVFWLAVLLPLVVLPITGLLVGCVLALSGAAWPAPFDFVDAVALAAFVMVLSTFTAASQLAIRLRSYGLLGRIPVLQMIGTLASQIALGAAGFTRGLFVGGLVGRSLGIVGLMRTCEVRREQVPSREEAGQLLRRFWRFPVIFAPASMVNVLGSNLPPLMLPALFGFGPAGLYAMALRIAGTPAAILGDSAGQVFLGEFSRANSISGSVRVFWRWSGALLVMAIALTSVVWIMAPLVLPFFLGAGWEGTAYMAQYAGIVAGAALVGSPVQHVWTVRQRGLMQFAWNVFRLAATGGAIWWSARASNSLDETVVILAWVTCAVYLVAWLGCLWAASRAGVGKEYPPRDPGQGPAEGLAE